MAEDLSPGRKGTFSRFIRAAQLFRPRTLVRLGRTDERLQQQLQTLSAEVQALKTQLGSVAVRERQLRAILETDYRSDNELAGFEALVEQTSIGEHTRAAIASAQLRHDPFPHCVVDNVLPSAYYDALIAALPPLEMFADRPENKQQLTVPLELASRYAMRVWQHMSQTVTDDVIRPAVADKFREPMSRWLQETLPVLGENPLEQLRLSCSDGRILLRRRGYRIPPHRDPKWGFITCLMYLARDGDDERWGTQLFAVEGDEEAAGAKPHWIPDAQCHLVSEVAFRRNRALIFLNSVGAHGAQIPADAEPANLERYAYQFRIGADHRSIESVRAQLVPEQRALWAGKREHKRPRSMD